MSSPAAVWLLQALHQASGRQPRCPFHRPRSCKLAPTLGLGCHLTGYASSYVHLIVWKVRNNKIVRTSTNQTFHPCMAARCASQNLLVVVEFLGGPVTRTVVGCGVCHSGCGVIAWTQTLSRCCAGPSGVCIICCSFVESTACICPCRLYEAFAKRSAQSQSVSAASAAPFEVVSHLGVHSSQKSSNSGDSGNGRRLQQSIADNPLPMGLLLSASNAAVNIMKQLDLVQYVENDLCVRLAQDIQAGGQGKYWLL